MMLTKENLPSFRALLLKMRTIAKQECGIDPVFIFQLTHSGRQSIVPMIAYRHPIYEERRTVTDENIVMDDYLDTLPKCYAESAKLAVEAGFDGVDVKSCHGYLFQELLSAFHRAAEHIAKASDMSRPMPHYTVPTIRYGESNLARLREELQAEMSRVADFDRSTVGMRVLLEKVECLCDCFFERAVITDPTKAAELFRLYDMVLTQRATLSAMLCSAEHLGTHGSALVDRKPNLCKSSPRQTRTLTRQGASYMTPVSPIPTPELWFETLLARKRQEMNDENKNR